MQFSTSILATGLTALTLLSKIQAASFYLITDDHAIAFPEQGSAQVTDIFEAFDDDNSALCDSASQGLECTSDGSDGASCSFTYMGAVNAWNNKDLTGTFKTHDSGFSVASGSITLPGAAPIEVENDNRCEPYTCAVTGFGTQSNYKGFRCVFDI
ncbi:MAG: hypothetical protein Q9162_006721 [Coniocarpon cinnabarinum]